MRPVCLFSIGAVLLAQGATPQEGTATLTGKVIAGDGAIVHDARLELRLEASPEKQFRTETDSTGAFQFRGLPSDQYTLKLFTPGFKTLFVKSIVIFEGEQKLLPPMKLVVSLPCGFGSAIDFIRYLSTPMRRGGFGGRVQRDQGPMVGNSPPVAGAEVILTLRRT